MLSCEGADPLLLAYELSSIVPRIISVPFNPSGSQAAIAASVADLINNMVRSILLLLIRTLVYNRLR